MKFVSALASLLAAAAFAQPAHAFDVMMVPVGGDKPKPVPMHPVDPKDSPEDIAKDAQRDLKDNRFYNKPGATRAQYDADWQECRLIARGSRTPAGSVPLYYNPAVTSPLAAGAGGAIGGLIAGMIAEGEQRRQNRKSCLLIRGWRMVELPDEASRRVSAMNDVDRNAYFNQIVGAKQVDGKITERKTFSIDPATLGNLNGATTGPESLFLGKKVDASVPVAMLSNEAVVVLAYRRPLEASAGKFLQLSLTRYDPNTRDLIYQPRDWKKIGDKTTYNIDVPSGDRKAGLEVQVVKLTPGDYVISSASPIRQALSSNCFGAPTFHVSAGEVLYVGDFIPLWNAAGTDGKKISGTAYLSRMDDARRILGTSQPQLASSLKLAKMLNGATYACSAAAMDRWDIAGAANVPDVAPSSAGH